MAGKKDEAPGPVGMLLLGIGMGGAGVAMAVNLLSGQAEFVHGPRTKHWLVALLGESCFSVLACVVCLLFGAAGLWFGIEGLIKGPDRKPAAPPQDDTTPRSSARREAAKDDPAKGEERLAVKCPQCGRESTVPKRAAGRRLRCPGCKTEFGGPSS